MIAWYLIHHGWFRLDTQWDTKEYAKYARNIVVRGLVPYRDFAVEYPPGALAVFERASDEPDLEIAGWERTLPAAGGISRSTAKDARSLLHTILGDAAAARPLKPSASPACWWCRPPSSRTGNRKSSASHRR